MNAPRPRLASAGRDDTDLEAIQELDLEARTALRHIGELLVKRKVKILDSGVNGWGQWLDLAHRIDGQWGRFGSSAGLQTLGLAYAIVSQRVTWESFKKTHKLVGAALFPPVIPDIPEIDRRRHEPHPDDEDPWKHRDFAEPIKVIFCVDALEPECQTALHGPLPELVKHLIGMRLETESCWTTRQPDGEYSHLTDRLPVTALALFALRRFPGAREQQKVIAAYEWLADRAGGLGEDIHALAGLALVAAPDEILQRKEVKRALRECDERLLAWIAQSPAPIVERPWINAYVNRSYDVDYIFLSPEVVVSLYFLKRGLTRESEAYVRNVVASVASNVNRGGEGSRPRGFQTEASQEGTVDQLWAARLLAEFRRWTNEQTKQAEARHASPPTSRWERAKDVLLAPPTIGGGTLVAVAAGVQKAAENPLFAAPAAVVAAVGATLLARRFK